MISLELDHKPHAKINLILYFLLSLPICLRVFFLSQVTAETLLLESNDTEKAILDLISILNITNIVIGIKKLPYTRYAITTWVSFTNG